MPFCTTLNLTNKIYKNPSVLNKNIHFQFASIIINKILLKLIENRFAKKIFKVCTRLAYLLIAAIVEEMFFQTNFYMSH